MSRNRIDRRESRCPARVFASHGCELGIPRFECSGLRIQGQDFSRTWAGEPLQELFTNAFCREPPEPADSARQFRPGSGIDLEGVSAGESQPAKDSQVVLGKPLRRISHCPQNPEIEIVTPPVRIPDLARGRSPGDRVDREITTRQVLVDRIREFDDGVPSVRLHITTKCRDLVHRPIRTDHSDRAVLDAERNYSAEQALDLLGPGVCGDIPIGPIGAEQGITDRPSDTPGLEPGRLEAVGYRPESLGGIEIRKPGFRTRDHGNILNRRVRSHR